MSREHIVSASFFEGNKITVEGFDWTGEKTVEIPLAGAVTKVLCTSHNSRLSELDSEIKKIGTIFRQFVEVVTNETHDIASQFVGKIDGVKFERWLLKTTLNVICASPKKYNDFRPNEYLAGLVFGKAKFDQNVGLGLYFIHPGLYGHFVSAWNFINVRPVFLTHGDLIGLVGVVITFWGIPFFLKTAETENARLDVNGYDLIDRQLYHKDKFEFFAGGKPRRSADNSRIEFDYGIIS